MEDVEVGDGVPIILLSGMASDERLFKSQVAAIPNVRVQPWVKPRQGETLRAYAARLAPLVDPGGPCIVGGASFGGVVALELAARLRAEACILIGGIRSPTGLPWRWRMLRPIAALGPRQIAILAGLITVLGRPVLSTGTVRRLARLSGPEADFSRWAMCQLVCWQPSVAARRIRTFHIHGAADRVLPAEIAGADVVVPGGSHALSLFSPSAVNEFVAGVVRVVEALRD